MFRSFKKMLTIKQSGELWKPDSNTSKTQLKSDVRRIVCVGLENFL